MNIIHTLFSSNGGAYLFLVAIFLRFFIAFLGLRLGLRVGLRLRLRLRMRLRVGFGRSSAANFTIFFAFACPGGFFAAGLTGAGLGFGVGFTGAGVGFTGAGVGEGVGFGVGGGVRLGKLAFVSLAALPNWDSAMYATTLVFLSTMKSRIIMLSSCDRM